LSVIHINRHVRFDVAVPRTVRRIAACACAVALSVAAFGPAIDYIRIEQFKSRMRNVAVDAALSGALAYVNRAAANDAEAAATDSFVANDAYRDGRIGTPMISVMATPTNMYGQNGYGVTVKLRADIDKRFDFLSSASETVTVSAMAMNPAGAPSKLANR